MKSHMQVWHPINQWFCVPHLSRLVQQNSRLPTFSRIGVSVRLPISEAFQLTLFCLDQYIPWDDKQFLVAEYLNQH